MYFKTFPKTTYSLEGYENTEVIDVLKRTRFTFDSSFSKRSYTQYTLEQGDTPDIIASKVYGSPEWWWLVLLFNDITNPFIEKYNDKTDPMGIKYSELNSSTIKYFYIERDGGDAGLDFQKGDILVLCSSSDTEQNIGGGNVYTAPSPIVDESSRGAAPIVNWISDFREAAINGQWTSRFSEGDIVGVIEPSTTLGNSSRLKVWGTVKRISTPNERVTEFISNDTGRSVSPLWSHLTNSMQDKFTPSNIKPTSVPSYEKTLIGGFLGMSGAAGSTYSSSYTPVLYEERSLTEQPLSRIKLLDDSYKFQAQSLLRDSLKQNSRGEKLVYSRLNSMRNSPISSSGGY
tara:strand:- start:598 stop:1632 length:1035 start_codon:yes stop_codon:yes gene_type:complete